MNGGTGKATSLVADIQKLVTAHKGHVKSFVVFMGGPELKEPIEKLASDKKISVPLVLLPGGPKADDIGYYKVNPKAENTVLLWNKGRITANFVDVTSDGFAKVTEATEKMLAN